MIFVEYAANNQQVFSCGSSIHWIAIAHTCRHWRFVALDCPELWGNLVFAGADVTEEMLRRSKTGPIAIKATLPGISPGEVTLDLVLSALEHLPRARYLHLRFCKSRFASDYITQDITNSLCTPAPRLESLCLLLDFAYIEGHFPLPESPFNGETPQLRRVQLVRCRFLWDLPLLKSLHHLEIKNPSVRPTMEQILAVLAKMPLLCTLILHDACPSPPNDATFHDDGDDAMHLVKLSTLDITDRASHCSNFLNRLSYPATTIVRLKIPWPSIRDFERFFSITVSTGGWGKDGKSIRSLFIEEDDHHFRFRGWITAYRSPSYLATTISQLELIVGNPAATTTLMGSLLVRVCKALPLSNLQTLHVALGITERHWRDAFGNCPKLRTVGLCDTVLTTWPAFDLFPRLRILILHDIDFEEFSPEYAHLGQVFQAFLSERKRRNVALKELHLIRCLSLTADYVRSLEDFVDEVTWDGLAEDHLTEEEDPYDCRGNYIGPLAYYFRKGN
jgi:hypothetical protein